MTILISILLAFLLLCFITYIDFQIWYKKQKREENQLSVELLGEIYNNYCQIYKHPMYLVSQKVSGNINVEELKGGGIIKVGSMDDMEIKSIYGIGLIEQTLKGGIYD